MEPTPLLGPGMHVLSLAELRNLAVINFPTSSRRTRLFEDFVQLLQTLQRYGVECDIWIDGSFLTEKNDPSDIDLTALFDINAFGSFSQLAQEFCLQTLNGGKKFLPDLDTFITFMVSDPNHPQSKLDGRNYWAKQWGVDRENWCKGYVCIRVRQAVHIP